MIRFAVLTAIALVTAATMAAAAPETSAPGSGTVDFCVTTDGICPLPRPAAPGTPCSCRWPKGTTSQGVAGE
jgi:hypothetical protein